MLKRGELNFALLLLGFAVRGKQKPLRAGACVARLLQLLLLKAPHQTETMA